MKSFLFTPFLTGASAQKFERQCGRDTVRSRLSVLESARQPLIAGLVLASFLMTQCVFPLATAYAQTEGTQQTRRSAKPSANVKSPINEKPADNVRLAQRMGGGITDLQGDSQDAGPIKPSARLGRPDPKISIKELDLSRPPTEKELREVGGRGGALSPVGNADVEVLKAWLNKELKQAGIPAGIKGQARPNTPAGQLLSEAHQRVERQKADNLSFGHAVQERMKRNFEKARRLFQQHLKEFPDSPWAGETMLRLAFDSQHNGRPGEAQALYDQLVNDPPVPPVAVQVAEELKADNTGKGRGNGQAAEQRTVKTLPLDDPSHPAFDVRQKAKVGWADMDIALGQWDDAIEKLQNIIETDASWRRRTWARSWLPRAMASRTYARDLRACGSQALSYVLASLGKDKAAVQVQQLAAPRDAGFSLAELAKLAAKHDTPMRGFKARPEQLAQLSLPLIVHFDLGRYAKQNNGQQDSGQQNFGQQDPGDSLSQPTAPAAPAAKATYRAVAKQSPKAKNAFRPSNVGHFLVLEKVSVDTQVVHLYDPLEKTRHVLSFSQLDREWSGYGVMVAADAAKLQKAAASQKEQAPGLRIALLGEKEMARIFGGCCCQPAPPGDLGPDDQNQPGTPDSPCGSPVWAINRVSLNMFVQDVPLWYSTPVGPDVSITMGYNSNDGINWGTTFGNKWAFNYSSFLIENPDGTVHIFMPDSSQRIYIPAVSGVIYDAALYHSAPGDLNSLVKLDQNHFELITPTDERFVYQLAPSPHPVLGFTVPTLVQVKDRRGNAVDIGFDNEGRIDTLTDAQGKETKLFYEDSGHENSITRIKDPFGRQAHFEYDVNNNLVRVTDMEGASCNYTYDAGVWMTQMDTPRGAWQFEHVPTYFAWPKIYNYKILVTDPQNRQEQFFWVGEVADPGHVQYTDKRGRNTQFYARQFVGSRGKVTQVVAPDNSTTNLTYDYWTGRPATITDPKGRITRLTYNHKGRVLTATDPKGRTTTYEYASNGLNLLSVTNSRNQKIVSATYNNYHQPLSITQDPDNIEGLQATSLFTYTDWGAPATVTDAKGDETVYTYDTAQQTNTKRLLSVAREGVTLGSLTYDRIGRVRTVTDVSNLTTTYDYNDLNRLSRVTYPDGTYSEQDSSCCGTGGATRDRAGRMQYVDYDAMKRPVRVQDPAGNTLSLEYDFSGNLTQILDAKGNVTSFEYDGLNRLVRKAYSNHTSETFAYDEVGNLIAMRDAKNRVTRYIYDEETDELLNVDYPTMPDVSFTYDDLGQMTSMSDALGSNSAVFTYDLLGRVKSENQPWSNDTVSYGYDELGRRSQLSLGDDDSYNVLYAFDSLGRPDSLTSPAGVFDYNYDDNSSRLSSIFIPNTSRSTYWYDNQKRLIGTSNLKDDGAPISKYEYGFDASNEPQRGVRTYIDKTMGTDSTQSTFFSYDTVNQLTTQYSSETPDPLVNIATTYDAMGNRTNHYNTSGGVSYITSYTTNRLNQYTQIASSWNSGASTATSTLSYDASGNLAQQSTVGTGSGSASHTEYVYDDLDRLTAVVKKDPTTGANVSKSEYVYDGFSRLRISKEFTWNGTDWDEVYANQKNRIYDGMDVIREQNVWGTNVATYVRDGNIGGLLSKENMTGDRFYYHYDGSGNVVGMTDAQQNVVAEYTYDAWGTLLSSSGSEAGNNTYRFSTKEYFADTGLYNYGYRFYSPGMGRWINRDPLGEAGGLNLYSFGPNSPINGYDPYGLDWVKDTSNFASGWGDTLSYGGTWYIREYFELNDVVDECSGLYFAGGVVGDVHQRLLTRGRSRGGPPRIRPDRGYRGGPHRRTSLPRNDELDSHHTPPAVLRHTTRGAGPAVQMDPVDHARTSSNGSRAGSPAYRQRIDDLINDGRTRDAMALEVRDVREAALGGSQDRTKYNQALQEMLRYGKDSGLIPGNPNR